MAKRLTNSLISQQTTSLLSKMLFFMNRFFNSINSRITQPPLYPALHISFQLLKIFRYLHMIISRINLLLSAPPTNTTSSVSTYKHTSTPDASPSLQDQHLVPLGRSTRSLQQPRHLQDYFCGIVRSTKLPTAHSKVRRIGLQRARMGCSNEHRDRSSHV